MRILILLLLCLFLSACSHFHRLLNPSQYVKLENKSQNKKYSESYESDIIQIDSDRVLKAVSGGKAKSNYRIVKLSSIDDEAFINIDEPFLLELNGVNWHDAMIVTKSSRKNNQVLLKLMKKHQDIQFINKCETIEVYNVDYLPLISTITELKHQLIVTPIYSKSKDKNFDCQLLGYQIRYGDQKYAKCQIEAGEIYNRFIKCSYSSSPPPPPIDIMEVLLKKNN